MPTLVRPTLFSLQNVGLVRLGAISMFPSTDSDSVVRASMHGARVKREARRDVGRNVGTSDEAVNGTSSLAGQA
jgi:hypothetical protein